MAAATAGAAAMAAATAERVRLGSMTSSTTPSDGGLVEAAGDQVVLVGKLLLELRELLGRDLGEPCDGAGSARLRPSP